MKRSKRFLCLLLTASSLLGMLVLGVGAAGGIHSAVAVVDASALRLRQEASTSSPILTNAYDGDYVVVLSQQGDWYEVQYGQQTGFMHGDYLRLKLRENANLGYAKVTCSVANLRSGPGTEYSIVSQAQNGASLYTIGFNNGWYKVVYKGVTAYIRSDLIDLTASSFGKETDPVSFTEAASGTTSGSGVSSGNSKPETTPAEGSSNGEAIVSIAKQYLGYPYIWGGSSPSGFDCSGFVQYVMKSSGYSVYRTATDQLANGSPVSRNELMPGDMVFFSNTYSTSSASHVGIYVGDGQFIHSENSRTGVVISSLSESYYDSRYIAARRIW